MSGGGGCGVSGLTVHNLYNKPNKRWKFLYSFLFWCFLRTAHCFFLFLHFVCKQQYFKINKRLAMLKNVRSNSSFHECCRIRPRSGRRSGSIGK
jgi:hypothetical protein